VDLVQGQGEESIQESMHRIWTESLGDRRRIHQVAKQDSYLFTLTFEGGFRCQDLLGEMLWGVDGRRDGARQNGSAALYGACAFGTEISGR
jgi:hypothetical protein